MEYNYLKPKTNILFSDLDAAFEVHPMKKDLTLKTNSAAIKESIKNLVLTNHYERPFHPEIGSNVSKMLFEPMIPVVANYLETEIYTTITNFEPRVKLSNIIVESLNDVQAYNVIIQYYEINATTITTVEFILERTR